MVNHLKKNSYFGLLLLVSVCAQAKPLVYSLPQSLQRQLKVATEQRQRGECEQKPASFNNTFYALGDKLLLFIGLPDYFCYSRSFMPITVDSKGRWQAGDVIESMPTSLHIDTTQQLWLISHWEVEAIVPFLHHSTDGVHWQEIKLPQTKIDCCFVSLKQICITPPQLELKLAGVDDTQVENWSTSLTDSLQSTPNWQPSNQASKQCQTTPLTSGDWQQKISPNGKNIWLESATHHRKIILPRWLN
jgi:hypothetical protein